MGLNILYESGYLETTGLVCPVCSKSISKDEGFFHVFNCQGKELNSDEVLEILDRFGFEVKVLKDKLETTHAAEKKFGENEPYSFDHNSSQNVEYYFLEFDFYLVII